MPLNSPQSTPGKMMPSILWNRRQSAEHKVHRTTARREEGRFIKGVIRFCPLGSSGGGRSESTVRIYVAPQRILAVLTREAGSLICISYGWTSFEQPDVREAIAAGISEY
jgi:hypothetical protein